MLNGYQIIDADSHATEPNDMWEKYLEPEFKSFSPSPDLKVKGEKIYNNISEQVRTRGTQQIRSSHPMSMLNGFDSESHVRAMKQMGGDHNLIFGSDYPHMDHKPNIVEEAVGLQERLPRKTVQKIFWYNPVRFYGLE